MQLANKSEGTIEAMEKRLTKRNAGPREKTEFEIMKESKIVILNASIFDQILLSVQQLKRRIALHITIE